MYQYLEALDRVLTSGKRKTDPQGIGNLSLPGVHMEFNLDQGFPLVTVKDLRGSWRAMRHELMSFFLKGSTNIKDLHEHNVHLWDAWAQASKDFKFNEKFGYPDGDLGPIYGAMWRGFRGENGKKVDQILIVDETLNKNPDSRRLIVSSWDPALHSASPEFDKVFIAPCHCFFQLWHGEGELSLILTQRSGDLPVGIPFNIAEYALLLTMFAQTHNLKARSVIHNIGDAHIYLNQIPMAKEMLTRQPKPLPRVEVRPRVNNILEYVPKDFTLTNYAPHPRIEIPVGL